MSNLPRGYKQTEVGVIPEDWSIKKLKYIVEGNRIPSGVYKDKNLYGQGNKIIKLGDVFSHDLFFPDLAQRAKLSNEELANYRVKIGDIFIALASVKLEGVGKVMLVNILYEDTAYDHNVALIRLNGEVDKKYICDLFKSYIIRRLVASRATQVGTTFLKASTILEFPLPLPPTKAEQTAIATALSDADTLIQSLEKLITKKRNIKQGAMQELLNPMVNGKLRMVSDGNSKIKKGWQVKKLGEVAEIIMGQSPRSEYYNLNGIGLPLIQGNADVENRKTIKRIFTSDITKRGKCGDIVMSVRAPVGEISTAIFNCCLGRGVCAIRYQNEYLYYYLIYFEKSWSKLSTGSTFDSVNSQQIKGLEIPIPPLIEQTRIATILSDIDLEIGALESKLSKYKRVKQGMMQELLTGKTRLI